MRRCHPRAAGGQALTDAITAIRAASPWLTADCAAAYLGFESERHFRERVAVRPDFPLPRYFGGREPRWKRDELDAWADKQTTRPVSGKAA